jgi:hypothetical protein
VERCAVLAVRRLLLILLLFSGLSGPALPAPPEAVVLVARADSPVTDLSSVAVRKLFLGVPVLVDGKPLHPIRNRSDARLDDIFLQQIVRMSQEAYERQSLIGLNRQGWVRLPEAATARRVVDSLDADPVAVSFMWMRDVEHNPRLKVLRVLWTE